MGVNYQAVLWNKDKKRYDRYIALWSLAYLVLFVALTFILNSEITIETLIIRAFGSLAVIILHIILSIGPLSRLWPEFLPLLYNRRHLGVSMFLAAAVHGIFSIIQFHTLGNVNPIVSVFTSNLEYNSLINFPFQTLGFLALLILFTMAATSHDFWLKNLSPTTWKKLHMLVYVAYGLIMMHVFLGSFQQDAASFTSILMGMGFLTLAILHISSGYQEFKKDSKNIEKADDNWVYACRTDDIEKSRAFVLRLPKERVAIFKSDGKLSAVSNVCKHQGGPLGEGKIIDGCITCPWHGYQYYAHNGQSPPPFTEKIKTYKLRLEAEKIYINPEPMDEGTAVEPVSIKK